MGKIYDWSTTDADNDDADSDIKAKGNSDSIRNADDNDRAIMGANARFLADNNGTRDASTADTMTYTSAQGFTSYVDGMTFLIGGVTNIGAATLNVDTLGAKDVKKYQGAAIEALEANDIITGQPMLLVYDGTQFILLNPGTSNGIANVVEDTSPQLGGNLGVNGKSINSPDGTDKITIPNGSINLQTNSTSRADITDSGVRLGGANARVTTILDEDAMGSDSATALATQQSIKAYVDANAGGGGIAFISEDNSTGVSTITKTGLSGLEILIVSFGFAVSSSATIDFQARASGGTWRTILEANWAATDHAGVLTLPGFGLNKKKIAMGNLRGSIGWDSTDNSATDNFTDTTKGGLVGYSTFSEQWDEFRIVASAGNFSQTIIQFFGA